MRNLTQVLDATAVLIPDFQTWGLSAAVFFSLYCCAETLGFPGVGGADSGLLLSLVLGYVVDVGVNLASFLSHTPAPQIANLPGPQLPVNEVSREVPAQHRATTASLRYWP
jgi:hypothetical protein